MLTSLAVTKERDINGRELSNSYPRYLCHEYFSLPFCIPPRGLTSPRAHAAPYQRDARRPRSQNIAVRQHSDQAGPVMWKNDRNLTPPSVDAGGLHVTNTGHRSIVCRLQPSCCLNRFQYD
ncbi:hypothetical protein WA026_008114 [Henosepilachna vigintioctopunctata]|uniref:Uncharacterized protein n=1 Tax=Henosepilachna vigintioctopunctata TaxID=420089 RepID=A0AAW1TPG2_9CUCU